MNRNGIDEEAAVLGEGIYQDRRDAGAQLAESLREYADRADVLVLALPRGGVPVGFEIARALRVPLDLFLVRKLGVPGQEELAFGALASGGVRVLNDDILAYLPLSAEEIDEIAKREARELARRQEIYRGHRPPPEVKGKIVILVDDGLATGATMRAAVNALSQQKPKQIIVAVPVAARETCRQFNRLADHVSCLCGMTPLSFQAVGLWYADFSQTSDEEVCHLLAQARNPTSSGGEK